MFQDKLALRIKNTVARNNKKVASLDKLDQEIESAYANILKIDELVQQIEAEFVRDKEIKQRTKDITAETNKLSRRLEDANKKCKELAQIIDANKTELNHPRQSRGLIIVSPSKGHVHESPKGDYLFPKTELFIMLLFFFLLPYICLNNLEGVQEA